MGSDSSKIVAIGWVPNISSEATSENALFSRIHAASSVIEGVNISFKAIGKDVIARDMDEDRDFIRIRAEDPRGFCEISDLSG